MSAVPPVCRRIRHLRRLVLDVYTRAQKRDWLRACRVYQNISSESTTEGVSDAMVVVWRQTARRQRQKSRARILRAAVSVSRSCLVGRARPRERPFSELLGAQKYSVISAYRVCGYSLQVRNDNGSSESDISVPLPVRLAASSTASG